MSGVHESAVTAPDGRRTPTAFKREDSDPLGEPLRQRPATNGPTFETTDVADEPTMPKSATMVSGVIDAIRLGRSRAQA